LLWSQIPIIMPILCEQVPKDVKIVDAAIWTQNKPLKFRLGLPYYPSKYTISRRISSSGRLGFNAIT